MPSSGTDIEDIPDLAPDLDNNDDDDEPHVGEEVLKDDDCVFMATIPCKVKFIQAMSNVLQQLAEASHKNSEPKLFHKSVPTHFHDFEDLFTKSSFDRLPDRKVWDYAINLVPDAKASSCKVYPLAPNEQSKMDEFIHKNLWSGQIHPSKLPMASPVFFIKKKDGSLCLVQDY
jgi:hypothetical protein